jgi:quercetin dioxygenase-like cupin family protein
MEAKMSDPEERLRERPSDRFAGREHLFNLVTETEKLRNEPGGTKKRHRQITLFRGGGMSLVLFDFDAGGGLSDHATDGFVTVHVLDGEARMTTAGHEYPMPAGSLLVLTPGVKHDIVAVTPSRVLLSVRLDPSEDERS